MFLMSCVCLNFYLILDCFWSCWYVLFIMVIRRLMRMIIYRILYRLNIVFDMFWVFFDVFLMEKFFWFVRLKMLKKSSFMMSMKFGVVFVVVYEFFLFIFKGLKIVVSCKVKFVKKIVKISRKWSMFMIRWLMIIFYGLNNWWMDKNWRSCRMYNVSVMFRYWFCMNMMLSFLGLW